MLSWQQLVIGGLLVVFVLGPAAMFWILVVIARRRRKAVNDRLKCAAHLGAEDDPKQE